MMLYPFKRGNWIVVISLFCFFSFVLMIGAQGASADGKKGCAKTCALKAAGHTCPMMMKASSESGSGGKESDVSQILTLDSFSKMEQYTCPMHPEVRSDKETKCPECGMKLVKEDFYEVYRCGMKECPHVKAKAGKCCGKDLQKALMSKDEYYQFAQLQDEYFCPMHPEEISGEAGKCSKCGMKLEMRTVQMPPEESPEMMSYTCPMHPDVVSHEAGKCPKCGMKLEMKTVQKAEEEPQQAAKYFCSMHPDQMSDKTGICLKCGMKLREQKATSEK
ncbi:MAG: heavy metal-binding domain-containing protein [Candidatus Zixiibacteriota bacterium]